MVNLGICSTKCPHCSEFNAALVGEKGERIRNSMVDCEMSDTQGGLGWDSEIPDGCPYLLEQKLMEPGMELLSADLKEEEEDEAEF
jgi:hypothetical protein